MALFERFKSQAGTPVPTTGEYIPGVEARDERAVSGWKGQSNAVMDRATQVYRQNPKLFAGLGLLALAGVLVGVKKGRISWR